MTSLIRQLLHHSNLSFLSRRSLSQFSAFGQLCCNNITVKNFNCRLGLHKTANLSVTSQAFFIYMCFMYPPHVKHCSCTKNNTLLHIIGIKRSVCKEQFIILQLRITGPNYGITTAALKANYSFIKKESISSDILTESSIVPLAMRF